MWLDRAIKFLLPREEHFFLLLQQGARCAKNASSLLSQCVQESDRAARETIVQSIKDVEREADRVIVEVYKELNRTFVTPIDRSDIYNLATELEGITDCVYSTALQIVVHDMEDLPSGSRELAGLIENSCEEIVQAVGAIGNRKGYIDIRKRCNAIKQCEDRGDEIFRNRIAEMFKHETNAIHLMKHKEFLEGLERTLDLCDDVGNALSTIVIKNS